MRNEMKNTVGPCHGGRSSPVFTALSLMTLLWVALFGAFGPAVAGQFDVNLDVACFKENLESNRVLMEVYFAFPRQDLKFNRAEEGYSSMVENTMYLLSESGDTIVSTSWNSSSSLASIEELKDRSFMIIDARGFLVEPGTYTIELTANDLNSGRSGHAVRQVTTPVFAGRELEISNIELAYNIETTTERKRFVKSGHSVLPNPSGTFVANRDLIFFFAEVYGLSYAEPGTGEGDEKTYTVEYSVLKPSGELYKSFSSRRYQTPGTSAVIASGINPVGLPAGDYKLRLRVTDDESGQMVTATKGFVLLPNPEVEARRAKKSDGLLAKATTVSSEEDAQRIRKEILYIATKDELSSYDRLSLEGKQNFLKRFWENRDPDPSTAINEALVEHYARWEYANREFSKFAVGAPNGWKTDMGRVWIIYGKPDDREQYPSSLEGRPWERWNYFGVEGGVYFIFIDEDGFGTYELIHSTARNEIKDPNWELKIKVGGYGY